MNNIPFIRRSKEAVLWLKRLVAGLSPRSHGFAPGSIHIGFVVGKVALGQVFLRVLRFSPANNILPLLYIHLSPPHDMCDSSDQAAHYHHLGPKVGASFLTRHFGWKQNKKERKKRRSKTCLCCWDEIFSDFSLTVNMVLSFHSTDYQSMIYWNIILKDSNDGALHSVLFVFYFSYLFRCLMF
jgi:hypothetical protein